MTTAKPEPDSLDVKLALSRTIGLLRVLSMLPAARDILGEQTQKGMREDAAVLEHVARLESLRGAPNEMTEELATAIQTGAAACEYMRRHVAAEKPEWGHYRKAEAVLRMVESLRGAEPMEIRCACCGSDTFSGTKACPSCGGNPALGGAPPKGGERFTEEERKALELARKMATLGGVSFGESAKIAATLRAMLSSAQPSKETT